MKCSVHLVFACFSIFVTMSLWQLYGRQGVSHHNGNRNTAGNGCFVHIIHTNPERQCQNCFKKSFEMCSWKLLSLAVSSKGELFIPKSSLFPKAEKQLPLLNGSISRTLHPLGFSWCSEHLLGRTARPGHHFRVGSWEVDFPGTGHFLSKSTKI